MSYCLNPSCYNPQNPDATRFCLTCGTKLLLKERYRAVKPIGRGSFGRTFLAVDEDKPSKPRCVIKQFFPQAQGTNNLEKAAELFNREAERLDELGKHPQIPDLLAHFEQDNRQYLVQEFVGGENLAEELAIAGVFSEAKIRSLLKDLLPVLQFVHDRQVIHRDIKPANIIRKPSQPAETTFFLSQQIGNLALVDFGAAKVVTLGAGTGTIIGSPEYVAPEQVRGQAVFASDLYSLGATCIHLLTYLSPFELFDINENKWVWRDYLNGNLVSNQLGKILDKLLENSLNLRYKSAAEVLDDLNFQEMTVTSAIATQSVAKKPSAPQRAPTWECIYTLTGHLNSVTSVAFSPDGETLASGSEDHTIEIWKLDAGKRWYTLRGHSDCVNFVAFSPDSQTLASCSRDKTIQIWDLKKGKWWYSLVGHSDRVYTIAFSPDGHTLASGSRDKTIQLWNLDKGKWMRTFTGHTEGVCAVAFRPDGQFLASGSRDKTVQIWEFNTGRSICSLGGHTDWVISVAFSPDGKILASGSRDGTINLWRVGSDGKGVLLDAIADRRDSLFCLAFSPDRNILASSGRDGKIYLWDANTLSLLEVLSGHSGDILSVAFSGDGKSLASGGSDRSIKIWR
ncbi:MAG TPA: serine/threonine-protein kinase [Kamptonema sp.]|nr:serine/threonine-protein kinase [Kamptonema sp.]